MEPGQKSPLSPLKLKFLALKGTQIHNLNQLRGLDTLKVLDIRNTLITNLEPLNKLEALQKIIISTRQLPTEVLSKLNKNIEVEVR
jgi:hypothetical protein